MGVARVGRGRSVAVDVDPNVQKKFENLFCFVSGGYPRFSQPAKTAYQHREWFGKSLRKSFAPMGRVWCELLIVAVKVVGWHLSQALINSRKIVCEDQIE